MSFPRCFWSGRSSNLIEHGDHLAQVLDVLLQLVGAAAHLRGVLLHLVDELARPVLRRLVKVS